MFCSPKAEDRPGWAQTGICYKLEIELLIKTLSTGRKEFDLFS